MSNAQRPSVTPRIARMLRELEGPPSEEYASAKHVATPTGKRVKSGAGNRTLATALMIGGGATAKAH
jgi:hypothetical protein